MVNVAYAFVHVILKKFSFSQKIPLYSATFLIFLFQAWFYLPSSFHFWVLSFSLKVMIYSKTVIVHPPHWRHYSVSHSQCNACLIVFLRAVSLFIYRILV